MAIENFFNPRSTEEAVRLMIDQRENAGPVRFLAGGTDILNAPRQPRTVINVKDLLRYVKREGDEFVIGAAATVTMIEEWDDLASVDGGLLRSCARDFASWQIRNMATVGGNLASAVPSADFAPPLFVLDARCLLIGEKGKREIPLVDFFLGAHESAVGRDLFVEVRFPAPPPGAGTAWRKIGRIDGDIAVVNAAAYVEPDDGIFREVRIALGAVSPTPIRATEAENYLKGKPITDEQIEKGAELARDATDPISDQRAGAGYRRELSLVLARRVIAEAAGVTGGGR